MTVGNEKTRPELKVARPSMLDLPTTYRLKEKTSPPPNRLEGRGFEAKIKRRHPDSNWEKLNTAD